MTRRWTPRHATAADLDDQARLFNLCFGKQKGADTFRWKYAENPDGPAVSLVACDEQGVVVGGYSYVPRRFRRDGEPIVLMQASDAMTMPAWRGQGIFTGLDDLVCEEVGERGVPWAFAYSGRLSFKGFLGNGWKCLGHAPIYRRRFKAGRSLRRLGRAGPLLALAAPVLDVIWGWRDRARLSMPERGRALTGLARFDDRVNRLFEEVHPRTGLVGERTARWLNWRYVDTPSGRHERFGLFQGDRMDGYLVAEFVDGNAYLVDHLARDGAAQRLILTVFTVLAHERGMEEATAVHFEHHPAVGALSALGFRRPVGNKPFRDILPWIVRSCTPDAPEEDLGMSRWHLADGDRDAEHMSP